MTIADFDREQLSKILSELGCDETYFAENIKKMIDKGGHNMAAGMKMLGELKGLAKKVDTKETSMLEEFGVSHLQNTVQKNRRLGSIEEAQFEESFDENK